MKKTNKILLTAALSTLCAGFAFGGVSLFSASAETQNDATKFNVNGAQVKYMTNETDSGIRFNFRLSTNYYNSIVKDGAFDGVTVNTAVIPTDMVGANATAEEVIGAEKALTTEIPASLWKANGDWMEAYAYLYDLPAVSYGRNISAVGYIVDGENTTYVTEVEVRSMAYVASAALYSTEYTPTEGEKEILNKYLANFDYGFSVEEESATLLPVTAGSYTNKQQLTVNANAPIPVTYKSSNDAVATVSATGEVVAVSAGSATITATAANGATDTFSVKVATPIDSKADLDEIAYAYKKDGVAGVQSKWSADCYYVFTEDIDYKGEYFVPIAAMPPEFIGLLFGGTESSQRWGVFGELNSKTEANYAYGFGFAGTIDGNGCTITNAVIPFGTTVYAFLGGSGNFIGHLTGTLKNIAFKGVTTETGEEYWAKYGPNGTHVSEYQETYYDYNTLPGWSAVNMLGGIVGMSLGTVDNVFVDMTMSIVGTGSGGAAALVAYNHPNGGKVTNCVAKITVAGRGVDDYWESGNKLGAGLLVGQSEGSAVIANSFVVVDAGVKTDNMYYGLVSATNVKRYVSVAELVGAQQANMGTYGYGEFWTNWLTPYVVA